MTLDAALLLAGTGLLLAMLLLIPIFQVVTSSEAREIDVARVMLREGEWLTPLRHGVVPSKPPLFHWAAAGLGAVRGDVTVAVARVVSLFSAFGVLALVVFTARAITASSSPEAAPSLVAWRSLLAGGVLVTTHGFMSQAQLAMVDMVFAVCVTGAISSVLTRAARWSAQGHYQRSGWHAAREWLATFFPWCAGAVLAKGPLGLLLPSLVVTAFMIHACGVRNALRALFSPQWGWVLFVAIALPWYLVSGERGGEAFLWRHVIFENLLRMIGSEEMNVEPWWFYLPSLARTAFPWSIVGAVLLWTGLTRGGIPRRGPSVDPRARVRVALAWSGATWLVVGTIFFSLAAGKRHAYLLPLFPALALLVSLRGPLLWEELSYRIQQRVVKSVSTALLTSLALGVIAAITVALAGEMFTVLSPHLPPVVAVACGFLKAHATSVAMVVGVSAATYLILMQIPGPFGLALRMFTVAGLLIAFSLSVGNGIKGALKDPFGIALDLQAWIPAPSAVAVLRAPRDEFFDVLLVHLDRDARFVEIARRDAEGALRRCPAPYLLVRTELAVEQERSGSLKNLSLEVLYVGRPLIDVLKERDDRELILMRCTSKEPLPPGVV